MHLSTVCANRCAGSYCTHRSPTTAANLNAESPSDAKPIFSSQPSVPPVPSSVKPKGTRPNAYKTSVPSAPPGELAEKARYDGDLIDVNGNAALCHMVSTAIRVQVQRLSAITASNSTVFEAWPHFWVIFQ